MHENTDHFCQKDVHRCKKHVVLIFFMALFSSQISGASAQTDFEVGKEISQRHCSRCHIVDVTKPFGGISSTPSFSLLVNALEDWEERFSSFYVLRPHPAFTRVKGFDNPLAKQPSMVPLEIELEDIDRIITFVRTLKRDQ